MATSSKNSRRRAVKIAAQQAETELVFGASHGASLASSSEDFEAELAEQRLATLKSISSDLAVLASQLVPVVETWQRLIHSAMAAQGFWQFRDADPYGNEVFGLKVALVMTELAELLEANRKSIAEDDKIPAFTGEEAEAADIVIRLLDLAGSRNWRLAEAIAAKMQFNLTRAFKHGVNY